MNYAIHFLLNSFLEILFDTTNLVTTATIDQQQPKPQKQPQKQSQQQQSQQQSPSHQLFTHHVTLGLELLEILEKNILINKQNAFVAISKMDLCGKLMGWKQNMTQVPILSNEMFENFLFQFSKLLQHLFSHYFPLFYGIFEQKKMFLFMQQTSGRCMKSAKVFDICLEFILTVCQYTKEFVLLQQSTSPSDNAASHSASYGSLVPQSTAAKQQQQQQQQYRTPSNTTLPPSFLLLLRLLVPF